MCAHERHVWRYRSVTAAPEADDQDTHLTVKCLISAVKTMETMGLEPTTPCLQMSPRRTAAVPGTSTNAYGRLGMVHAMVYSRPAVRLSPGFGIRPLLGSATEE